MTFYHRRTPGGYSIERVFADVRRSLPDRVDAVVAISRFASRGLFRPIYNTVEAAFRQGDVNHVTGDAHYLTLLLHKKKTLLTITDLVSVHRLTGWRRALFLLLWYRLPIRRAEVVSVISESTKQDLLRHIAVEPAKIRVVPCCVSDEFTPTTKQFNAGKPVVLLIGTVPSEGKNVERVVQALQGLSCHVRIIGTLHRSQLAKLRQCRIEYSSVSDISAAQIVEEYRRCDIVVFASMFEGFGLPIVEAQATGRPVVTSTVWAMPEVAGDGACLVDPADVTSIRQGVCRVINDPMYRDELVRKGLENTRRFRPTKVARQYFEIYQELLEPIS